VSAETVARVASVLCAVLTPAGVWFGIRIGRLRERDAQAAQRPRTALLPPPPWQAGSTRHLLNWNNGKGLDE
jgi:hypothetical protein